MLFVTLEKSDVQVLDILPFAVFVLEQGICA